MPVSFFAVSHGTSIGLFEINIEAGRMSVRRIRRSIQDSDQSCDEKWYECEPMVACISHGIQFYHRDADVEANPDSEIPFLIGLFETIEDATSCFETMHGMADGRTPSDGRFWFDSRWVEQSAKTLRVVLAPGSDALLVQNGETIKYPAPIHEAIQSWAS